MQSALLDPDRLWLPLIEETCSPRQDLVDALAAFRAPATGPTSTQAAALKLVRARLALISCVRREAKPGFEGQIEEEYKQARELVQEQLQQCDRHSWGEAAMKLALAEVHVEKRSNENFRLRDFGEALENAEAAQEAFREAGDPDMAAQAWLVAADVHRRGEVAANGGSFKYGSTKAFQAFKEAKDLFEKAGNVAGVGRAKHGLGIAHIFVNELNDGLELLEEAYQHFVNAGDKVYQALELLTRAQLQFKRKSWEAGRASLEMAQEALEIFAGYGASCGHRLVEARETVVQAHLWLGDTKSSMRVATEWVDASEDDPRQHCNALMSLARTWVADENLSEGVRTMEQALLVSQETSDEMLEFECLLKASEIHSRNLDTDRGWKLARQAIDIAQRRQDRRKEADAIFVLNQAHFKRVWVAHHLDEVEVDTYMKRVQEQRAIWLELEEEGRATLVRLGTVGMLGTSGNYEEGKDLAEECEAKFQELQDKHGEATALLFQTQLYNDLEDPEMAANKARDMQRIGKLLRDDQVRAKALRAESRTHIRSQNFKAAIRAAEKALSIAERMRDVEAVVEYLTMVANCCTDYASWQETSDQSPGPARGRSGPGLKKKALGQARTALNLARRLRSKRLEGTALVCLGKVQLLLAGGQEGSPSLLDDALKCFVESIDIFQHEPGCTELEATATVKVAQVHLLLGHWDKALDAAEVAWQIARSSADAGAALASREARLVIERVRELWPQETFASEAEYHGDRPFSRSRQRPPHGRSHGGHRPPSSRPEPSTGAAKEPEKARLMAGVESLDLNEIRDSVMEMVKTTVRSAAEGQALGEGEVIVHVDTPLVEVGIDSFTAVSFRNGLQKRLGLKLPGTWIQDFPTAQMLVKHLAALRLVGQM